MDEVKAANCAAMGRELGEVYSALSNELSLCSYTWRRYVELFGTSEDRIDVLNKSASNFFGLIERVMWDDTLLHLARLTDPSTTMGRKNLSVYGLQELITDAKLKERISELANSVRERTKFARDWRNRLLAHRDLDIALERPAKPLEAVSRKNVEDALASIGVLLNEVDALYTNSETSYDVMCLWGGVDDLLSLLGDGLRLQEEREKQWESES
jgi:hypothetical protein